MRKTLIALLIIKSIVASYFSLTKVYGFCAYNLHSILGFNSLLWTLEIHICNKGLAILKKILE